MKRVYKPVCPAIFYPLYFLCEILLSEFLIRAVRLATSGVPVFLLLFSLSIAALLGTFCVLLPPKGGKVLAAVLSVGLFLLYGTQFVYHYIYKSFLAVTQLGMGGEALSAFGGEALSAIWRCAGWLALLLLPTVFLFLHLRRLPKNKDLSARARGALILLVLFLLLHIGTVLCLPIAGEGIYSPYDLYNDPVKDKSERTFGVLTATRLEVKILIFGKEKSDVIVTPEVTYVTETETLPPEAPPPVEYAPHMLDIDFDTLAQNETRDEIRQLHEYFADREPDTENEYTGMFKGYNLIVLCCESFSPFVIDKERTPTLYKMATEGFVFSDFHDTVCDNTSNGEYALNIGLLPDTTLLGRGWTEFYYYNSFTTAQNNALPFCFGNQLRALGYRSYAFHNYFGYYYGRNKTHPNMGYDFWSAGHGLAATDECPTSDVSMMEQALDVLLKPDESGEITPFHAYFLTFSGHMPYNFSTSTASPFSSNDMALKNKDYVKDMPYSTRVLAYIAAQEELEYAMEYLFDTLEEAGQLDNTLILLTPDHYPYNLGLDDLSELAGQTLDEEFGQYTGTWLMYAGSMKAPIKVDVPCCTLDILPTVSNLMGLPYDSRLLMGKDVFAEGEHVAVLADRSFITDEVYYNVKTGEAKLRGEPLADGYLDYWIAHIKNKFSVSTEMLYSDYYSIVCQTEK